MQANTQHCNFSPISYTSSFTMAIVTRRSQLEDFLPKLGSEPLSTVNDLKTKEDIDAFVEQLQNNEEDLSDFMRRTHSLLKSKCTTSWGLPGTFNTGFLHC